MCDETSNLNYSTVVKISLPFSLVNSRIAIDNLDPMMINKEKCSKGGCHDPGIVPTVWADIWNWLT